MRYKLIAAATALMAVSSSAQAWVGEIRHTEANGDSIYAYVFAGEGFTQARAYCQGLTIPGVDGLGDPADITGFDITVIDSLEELDFVQSQVYEEPVNGGLRTNTWTGFLTYAGAPSPSSAFYNLVFTENDAEVFQESFRASNHSFVCEANGGGTVFLPPEPEPTPTPEPGDGVSVLVTDGGDVYAFVAIHTTFEGAVDGCAALETDVEGTLTSGFSVVDLGSEAEQAVVHGLITANGGPYTWAGTASYATAPVPGVDESLVFTDFNDATVLESKPVVDNYAYVCEL